MKRGQNGFTLLELAIVLLIIALVAGAILGARSVVRTSQLQAMLGEYDAYLKAVKEFQDKFLALPGDMKNAENMWGPDTSCPNTPSSSTPHIATCNGDGNGTIGTSDTSGNPGNSTEWFRAWQQLSDAGLISATFTGTPGSGGIYEARPGLNVPASAVAGAGWMLYYYSQLATNASLWGDQYGHIMVLGGFTPGSKAQAPVLTATEALSVDQKIDDGNPGLGIVRAYRNQANCTNDTGTSTTGSPISQAYISSSSAVPGCSLIFLMRF